MRSSDVRQFPPAYLVPQVSAHQLVLDGMVKHLRKLRWIGKEREAQKMFQALRDVRLQPFRLPSSSLQPCEVGLDHSRRWAAEQKSAHAAAPVD
jgi:hypothetical protein